MASDRQISFDELMQAVEDKLLDKGVVQSREQVVWAARDQIPHLAAKKDVVLRPGSALSVEPTNEGGGRYDTRVRRHLSVFVRSMYLSDKGAADKEWLKQHFPFEDSALNALHGFHPEDSEGNVLLIEPMRLTTEQAPERETGNRAWGDSAAVFECLYYPAITRSDEA